MLRHIIVFITTFPLLFLLNTTDLKKEELKVELTAPQSAAKGSEFEVELKITGGSISGFAKYIDNLPNGLTAEAVDIGDATFTADNGQVKILWVDFPKSDEVILKYKVKVSEDAPIYADFGGKFSYLDGGEKKVFSVFKKNVKFGSENELAEEAKSNEPIPVEVKLVRRVLNSKADVHQIEIEVFQKGLDGFGKIQEFVPLGAEIEQGENQNASYSQIKNKVKYVWMSMPKSESFKVSYYIDLSNADSKDVKSITGNFSYLDNDVTKKLNVVWADESEMMAQASSSNQNNQEASNGENSEEKQSDESEIPTNNSTSNSSPKPNSETVAVVPVVPIKNDNSMEDSNDAQNEGNADDTNLALNESSANNENDEVEEQNTNEVSAPLEIPSENANNEIEEITAQNESNDETTLASNESTRTEVESSSDENEEKMGLSENSSSEIAQVAKDNTGVRYRVQIAAGKNIVNAAYFQKKHQFESEFNVENHQGWVKYTTGSFGLYKDARDSREVINSAGHNFDGPFVTAYNQGQRITVQEALMITSQKWYK